MGGRTQPLIPKPHMVWLYPHPSTVEPSHGWLHAPLTPKPHKVWPYPPAVNQRSWRSTASIIALRENRKSQYWPPVWRHSTAERTAASSRARISATTPAWPR